MGSVFDVTNNTTYELTPDVPLILGRLQVNKSDPRISRAHVQITLLDDQRCFVQSMSSNPCTLDDAILPKKLTEEGHDIGQEVEAFNDQWIHLLPGKLYPLRLTLPKTMTTPTPRKPLIRHEKEIISDDDNDSGLSDNDTDENMDEDEQESASSMEDDAINIPSQDEDRALSYRPSTPSSIISTESSLIGGEQWSD